VRIEYEFCLAILLDWMMGDPRWMPHPVRYIGRFAMWLEAPLRRLFANAKFAGIVAAVLVIGSTAGLAFAILFAASFVGAWLHTALSIVMLYFCVAARDLANHALAVEEPLLLGDIEGAKASVSRIVGRDTDKLDEQGIVRATVESVAENTVDGVTAPLFFAILGGPVAVLAYKAASTLDSTFGYKNERYIHFGWASARIDDVAAWIPARITLPIMALAAGLLGHSAKDAWRIGRRDGSKHPSPNSGISEATMAGALGVQLGGPLYRHGELAHAPEMGEPVHPLELGHIRQAVSLMLVTELVFATVAVLLRMILG